jgi:hypothetical protein
MKRGWHHIVAIVLIALGVVDLGWGDTNQAVLPSFIGDYLTQQVDVVLILAGGVILFFF